MNPETLLALIISILFMVASAAYITMLYSEIKERMLRNEPATEDEWSPDLLLLLFGSKVFLFTISACVVLVVLIKMIR